MNVADIAQLISSVGFPIAACCVMFWQNDKLQKTLNEISSTMILMNERIQKIENKVEKRKRMNNMKIVESLLTKNPCYTAGRKIEVKGLMLHSVGCSQPNASVFVKSWNNENFDRACVHGFIDANTGDVYQCLPWNHRGWHGGGSSNNTHVGVEMCEPESLKYVGDSSFTCSNIAKAQEQVKRTYQSAVELFAYLCKEYKLNPLESGVIVSHSEGCKLGIASNHADPEHLWKGLSLPYTMNGFREDVANAMGENAPKTTQTLTHEQFIEEIAKCVNQVKNKYQIKVSSPVIAQAIIESGWGTSSKAQKNNFFGLKYREGRVSCHNGTFVDGSAEQLQNGQYIPIECQWYSFENMLKGVEGYFQFINISRYANLKNETDPRRYIEKIKEDGYATSLNYVESVWRVVQQNNLTRYDSTDTIEKTNNFIEYKVQRGDTLSKISKQFGTTVEQIAKDNNIKNVNLIYVGQVFKIRQ